MLTGILIAALVGAALGGGFFVGRKRERFKHPTLYRRLREAERDLLTKDNERGYLEQRIRNLAEQGEHLRQQRDQYKEIATSHEVTLPEVSPPKVITKEVWKNRLYHDTISHILKYLAADMVEYQGQEVMVHLDVEPLGGWKSIVKKYWKINWDQTGGLNKSMLVFQGPAERVVGQIERWFKDDDHGFVIQSGYNQGDWRDEDSPMKWEVDLEMTITEDPQEMPTVQYVKVAVVEREIEERIVKVPVSVGTAESLLLEPDVVELVDAALEIRGTAQGRLLRTMGAVRVEEPDEVVPLLQPSQDKEIA